MRLPGRSLDFVLLLVLVLTGCDLANKLTAPDKGLAIKKFIATPDVVAAGETVTLDWEVVGTQTVEIDNGIGAVMPKGSREVRPNTTTVYTLRAQTQDAAAASSVRVTVR